MTAITSTEAGATGRYINLGSPASQDDIGAQTIIAYCKPTASGGGGAAYLFGKTPTASTGGPRFYILDNAGSPSVGFGQHSTTAAAPSASTASGTMTYGGWQHLTVTWDGTVNDSGIALYIGSTLTANSVIFNGSGSIVSDAANDLFLMNRGNSGALGREFVGDIGYIARWNRVLNSTERATVISNGPLDVPSGLTLCWANQQDYSTNALTPTARSTFVAGSAPTNTALGGTDTTAPVLTSPTGTQTGSTTASGTVSTDEGNGTLYWLASVNATELLATVKAGSSQAVTATGSQAVAVTGLTASTAYYLHYAHTDAATNDSAVVDSAQFTTAAADTTAPVLTLPTGTATGSTTATGTVTTDEGNGTLYYLVSINATELLATVKAGSSQAVSASGLQNVTLTGLTESTGYYLHYAHTDASANDSAVANSALFTTDTVTKGVSLTLSNGATLQTSLTGIRALWWDAIDPTGAPTYSTATASTNASGVLVLDLDASTADGIGDYGFLLLYKVSSPINDSLAFAGQVAISDIT